MWLTIVWLTMLHYHGLESLELPENIITTNTSALNVEIKEVLGYEIDAALNFTQLCQKHGYPVEEYTVTTDDGYILTMFRIRGNTTERATDQPPVLFVHGYSLNADCWIIPGPIYSIAYQIINAGYDAWFANCRGTQYGRKHVKYDPDMDVKFWRFSFDEMAEHDLPKWIDKVLEVTGRDVLSYVGHSQGNVMFYANGMYNPDYYKKVNVMVGLAPCSIYTHAKGPLFRLLSKNTVIANQVLNLLGSQELFRHGSAVDEGVEAVCQLTLIEKTICQSVLGLVARYDPSELRDELMKIISGHVDSVSKQNTIHLGQLFASEYFQKYDHGKQDNLKIYGSERPPQYNISLVDVPVYSFIGENDYFANMTDVDKLVKMLPKSIEKYVIPWPKWAHCDYLWATQAPELIGEKLLTILKQYNTN